jgi:plasmid stability protein
MKKKIGTVIDEAIFRRLRVHAADRGRSVSDVIEESIAGYLALHEGSTDERLAAFERYTSRPFRLSRDQLDLIIEEEPLDQ